MLPDAARPYAKAIIAVLIPLVGLAVTFGFFDQDAGAKITAIVVAIATGLGVYRIANRPRRSAGDGATLAARRTTTREGRGP